MIAYDQYQRYKTISTVVEKIKAKFGLKKVKILEVGANAQKNLGKFLKDDEIFYTDLAVPEGFEEDDHFFVADATNLAGIKEESYDVIIASDVFEHIPKDLREKFVSELYRVVKYSVIMCFPFSADYVEEAEIRVNQYYKTLTGEDYIWLAEHIENGLPKRGDLDEKLKELGISFAVFEHGDVEIWEQMLQNHFFAVQYPDLIPYREKIDDFYDKYIYGMDVSKENYRCFYLLFKGKDEAFYKELAQGMFQSGAEKEKRLKQLERMSTSLKDISSWKMQLNQFNQNNYDIKEFHAGQLEFWVYYDFGKGFLECNKTTVARHERKNGNFIELEVPEGVRTLRVDPIEGKQMILNRIEAYSEGGKEVSFTTNGIRVEGKYVFPEEDPQLLFDVKGIRKIKLDFEITKIDNTDLEIVIDYLKEISDKYKKIEDEKQKTEEKLKSTEEKLKGEKQEVEEQLKNTERFLQEMQNLNQAIYQSFSWKITKPVRLPKRVLRYLKRRLKNRKTEKKRNIQRKGPLKKINEENIDADLFFSIVVPLYNTELKFLEELIRSALKQTYPNWELCLVDASDSRKEEIATLCKGYEEKDQRIRYLPLESNQGISKNTNVGIDMAKGSYIVLCDHDDVLGEQALYMTALAIKETNGKVLYSDEDHVDEKGRHKTPFFKPDWSRDLLYSQMYTCHLFVFEKELFRKIGGFDPDKDGSQDYDLMLRFSEETDEIVHIPYILYSWRETASSTAANADAKPYAHTAGFRALNEHLKRKYGETARAQETEYTFVYQPRFDLMKADTLISIIMPMKDNWEMTENCIHSICEKSTYQNFEILLLNNRSEKADTLRWFEKIKQYDGRVKVIEADFEFNWSKLNNFGMKHAKGDVYIFMNNDTLVITPDWMERLAENALRKDIGVVGPLLLYEDDTIQHAGIIVGMGGWADHVFKGMEPVHCGTPYVSPMVSRNVTAVTGACMAISKETIEDIGEFDDEFIICGSDVEICIRAYEKGYRNLYQANARLYHLESKSRDSYIPEIDFKKSYECYTPFRENGDPYFNPNLDQNSVIPKESRENMNIDKIKRCLKRNPFIVKTYVHMKQTIKKYQVSTNIPEVQEILPREYKDYKKKRLNLLVPSLNVEHVFGGIATALKFYKELGAKTGYDLRVIITDSILNEKAMVEMEGFKVVSPDVDSDVAKQIVPFSNRFDHTIPVGEQDIFMATAWWTTYNILPVMKWQKEVYGTENKLIYFIQDYEPGFYPWSSRYLMADSTYKADVPMVAVFNSKLLYDFFKKNGYEFANEHYFEPVLNDALKKYLLENSKKFERKKQILIYGRPGTERNAFELIVASLNQWCKKQKDAKEWNIISAGEEFADVELCNGQKIKAVGKLPLDEYGKMMLETKVGISLMVSPHPSYPPLEMSTFGVKVITNTYGNKDLSSFNENMVSLSNCSSDAVALKLVELCSNTNLENKVQTDTEYVKKLTVWDEIISDISNEI